MSRTDVGRTTSPPGEPMADGGEQLQLEDRTVPGDAVAADVPCPHCGKRPIESVAKGYRITGMILLMRQRTLRFVGCQPCIRRKLLGAALKNLFLGWWGIKSFVFNLFAIPWNVFRALVNRGPNENLVAALDEAGIPYEWLDDREEFDAGAHHDDELYLNGMLRLGAAMMAAGGSATEEEVEAVLEVTGEAFPEYDREEIRTRLGEFAEEDVDAEAVSAGLGMLLTDEGKQLVVGFAMNVAAADDEIDDEEAELFGEIAAGLGLSEEKILQLVEA